MSNAKVRYRRRRRAAIAWANKGGTDGFLHTLYADVKAFEDIAMRDHGLFTKGVVFYDESVMTPDGLQYLRKWSDDDNDYIYRPYVLRGSKFWSGM